MKLRMIIVGIAATLALAGSSLALGSGAERKVAAAPVATHTQPLPKSLMKTERALAKTRVRCGNIQCVNGALTALAQAFRQMHDCISYMDVARYDGYAFSNDGGSSYFRTTALDAASPGDPATHVAVIIC